MPPIEQFGSRRIFPILMDREMPLPPKKIALTLGIQALTYYMFPERTRIHTTPQTGSRSISPFLHS